MRESLVELKRRVARDVAVLAARVLEHLRDRVERGEALGARGHGLFGGRRAPGGRKKNCGERTRREEGEDPRRGSHASLSGRSRSLFPVAAKSAFATAGAIGGVPGSPTPPGLLVAGQDVHLDVRHLGHPQDLVIVEVALDDASLLRA